MSSSKLMSSVQIDDEYATTDKDNLLKTPPPTPPIVYLYIVLAAAANLLFGYENSNVSGAKIAFASDYHIDTHGSAYGFIAAAMAAGATLSCPFAGFLQDRFGRRVTLIIACVFYIGAVTTTATAHGYSQMVAGRVLTGMAIGVFSSTAPMFISELAPPAMRGRLGAVNQLCICVGIMFGYISCYILDTDWRAIFAAAAPLAVLLAIAFVFVTPFSPRWLLTKGREEEARRVLERIRGPEATASGAVEAEIRGIVATVEASKDTDMLTELRQRHVLWSISIGIMLSFFQQWCGCNAVNAYAPDIISGGGKISQHKSSELSIYIGLSKVIFVIVTLYVMDKFPRRTILIGGSLLLTFFLVICAVLMMPSIAPDVPQSLAAVPLFLYMKVESGTRAQLKGPPHPPPPLLVRRAGFELSLGPLLWLLLSELYPLSIRGVAMAVGSTACWFFTVSVTLVYPSLAAAVGQSNVFWVFTGVCLVGAGWFWKYVPETRGKTLEEIEAMLKEGRKY